MLSCIESDVCRGVRFNHTVLDYTIPGMSDVMPYPSTRYRDLSKKQLDRYEHVFGETLCLAAKDFTPDIIHSHHLWLASATARRVLPDIPLVTSCHSSDLRQFQQCPHLQEKVLRYCRKIDRVLALSKEQAVEIMSLYDIAEESIDVVGGGYEKEVFKYRPKSDAPPVHLLYAGKLSFSKGVDQLLETVMELGDKNLHLHLAGSGTGNEARRCLDLAEKAGTGVTVHGRIEQRDLAELMARCHVFILPSFYEGLPLVVLEAMASGCRVITTNLPGCREVLSGADKDLIRMVPLPEMVNIDQPNPKDIPLFKRKLATAIVEMAEDVRAAPSPSIDDIEQVTAPYSWRAVFAKIRESYVKAVAG